MKKQVLCLATVAVMTLGSVVPAMAAGVTATPNNASVAVNGKNIAIGAYNIGGYNYFKLRDVAAALNGTDANFEVGYDSAEKAISLKTKTTYTVTGNELKNTAPTKKKMATVSDQQIMLDGKRAYMQAFLIDGYNYFQLRELGDNLGFDVTWDAKKNAINMVTSEYAASIADKGNASDNWRQLYKKALLNRSIYEEMIGYGVIDLIDLDQNEIPEMYVSSGHMPTLYLDRAYDASSGTLKSKKDYNLFWGNSVHKDKTTGKYVLHGYEGGSMILNEFWLIPKGNLDFEFVYGGGLEKSVIDENGNREITTWEGDFDDSKYVFVENAAKTLTVLYGEMPSESVIDEFLGIESNEVDWVGLYKKYMKNKSDWDLVNFVCMRDAQGNDGVPELLMGYHAMADSFTTTMVYIADGKVKVKEYDTPVGFTQKKADVMMDYHEFWDRGPNDKEIEKFLNSWK